MTDKSTDRAFYMTRLDKALADTLRPMNEAYIVRSLATGTFIMSTEWIDDALVGKPIDPLDFYEMPPAHDTKADSDGDDGA